MQVAVDALASGLDSPALRLLAGERSGTPYRELDFLFEKAADELGCGGIDVEKATFIVARDITARIVSGELTEAEGGRRIYQEVYLRRPWAPRPTTCGLS